jgi:ABC-2 type transport system permease protein
VPLTREQSPRGALILFRHELGAHFGTFLVWAVPTAVLVATICALQPSFAGGVLAAKIESLPAPLRRAFGMQLVDFQRPAAYLATNFPSITLVVCLFAAILGARVVAKEETLHTAELLYVQPVSRVRILLGKAAALALYTVAFPLVLGTVAVAVLAAVASLPIELGVIALLFAGALALAVCFAGAGMLVAALVRDARSAGGGALAFAIGTYFVGVVSTIAEPAAPLRWLSPYKWVDPMTIVVRGDLDPLRAAVLIGLGVVFGAVAIARYRRRDILA